MNDVKYQTIEDTIQNEDEKMRIKKIMKAIVEAKLEGKTAIDDSGYLDTALKQGRDRVLPKLKRDLRAMTNDLKHRQQQVDNLRKEVQTKMDEIELYENQVKEMENFDIDKILDSIDDLIYIDNIEVDFHGRVLVTTKPLTIEYNVYDEYEDGISEIRKMDVGRYQVRIDFSKNNFDSAIRAVNLDWFSLSNHPHPCIGSGTNFCWGNAHRGMERDYNAFDVVEVIRSLGEFLRSGNDRHGHTRWNLWKQELVPAPEGYSVSMQESGVRYNDTRKCFLDKDNKELPFKETDKELNDRPANDDSKDGKTN